MVKKVYGLILVTFIPSTEKLTATSYSFLYAKHIEIYSEPFIVYLQSKYLPKFMQPNIRYLIYAN